MVGDKVLIIEGAKDTRNGILRQGFNKLLVQKLEGNMPRIVMGEGKQQAIDKFINYRNSRKPYLLVDLDNKESEKENDLKNSNLIDHKKEVYFMIQEMEAWFLSQPDVLNSYYASDISGNLPDKHTKEIDKPSDFLFDLTKRTKKGKYHKIKHAVDLLQQLDAARLMEDFDDFDKLVKALKN